MKKRLSIFSIAALLSVSAVEADERDSESRVFDIAGLQWYGSINAAYFKSNGELDFYGKTASVYGGLPTIQMDDGGQVSFAYGFETPGGWRLEGTLGYANSRTDTASVFGLDDRATDIFAVDAEIESVVFMLNGSYEFNLSNSRITPFVKAGIGVARNKVTDATLDVQFGSAIWAGSVFEDQAVINQPVPNGQTTEFVWNISAGAKVNLTQRLALSLEYGRIDLGDAVSGTTENGDAFRFGNLISDQLSLGLDFRF